ncbi:unnamed protein product [Pieris macdunnoughi]|uniref:Uncharacterized protein n=1 Tax=Pieris macdunnoughi TaxID=345717 RepID=A0A821UJ09_9NEOP|nr:unnamed protein product [Pieris macdunnoughi]
MAEPEGHILKKIPKPRSGDSPSNYEPAWKYFTLLGFLKDEYMPLAAELNLDEEDSVIIDNEINDDMSIEDEINITMYGDLYERYGYSTQPNHNNFC